MREGDEARIRQEMYGVARRAIFGEVALRQPPQKSDMKGTRSYIIGRCVAELFWIFLLYVEEFTRLVWYILIVRWDL